MSDREELYRNWVGWVTTNLGRDPRFVEIAATAATNTAELGRGFNDAEEAARLAWADAAKRYVDEHRFRSDGQRRALASLAEAPLALEAPPASPIAPVIRAKRHIGRNLGFTAVIAGILTCAVGGVLIGPPQSRPISVGKAISIASATTGQHRVDRSAAKLMMWKDFRDDSTWVCFFSCPSLEDSQLVWVVALAGDIRLADDPALQLHSEIVVVDTYSGEVITYDSGGSGGCTGPPEPFGCRPDWPNDWPPYWDQLPNRSHT